MSVPHTFATIPTGNVPASYLDDNFSNLDTKTQSISTTQMASLTSTVIGALTSTQMSYFTTTQIAGLTSTQAGALSSVYFAGLNSTQMASLTTSALAGLSSTQVTAMGAVPARLGTVVQSITETTTTQTVISGSGGVIPNDGTIPQNTEGVEILTVTITPTKSTNILILEWHFQFSAALTNAQYPCVLAVFQDSTANAIAAECFVSEASTNSGHTGNTTGRFSKVSGTTSATTFKIRMGITNSLNSANLKINETVNFGLNNLLQSSLTVYEVAA